MSYLALAAVVFGLNLLPAFGPPTWAVLVLYRLNSGLDPVPLVLVGALAAASGRLVLAHASGRFRGRLSERRQQNLDVVRDRLVAGRGRSAAALALFAVSPVPSAQLFVAAGLMRVRLLPLTLAFFAGRLVSYSLYVGAASAAKASLGSAVTDAFTSPAGVAVQLLMVAGLVALLRIDWLQVLARHGAESAAATRDVPRRAHGQLPTTERSAAARLNATSSETSRRQSCQAS